MHAPNHAWQRPSAPCWAMSAATRAQPIKPEMTASKQSAARWAAHLDRARRRVERLAPPPVEGVLTRMVGLTLEAAGCQAAVGDRCDVIAADGARIEAEVVGFSGDRLYLMPTGDIHGLKPNARVIPQSGAETARVGSQLLGRIIDGAGQPLDGLGPLGCEDHIRLTGTP